MRFRPKSCQLSRIGVHLKAFLPPLPRLGKALCTRRGCVRGEGRALFCTKAPFLPPAPPIHPAKNLAGRMTGNISAQGVPRPPVPRRHTRKARERDGGMTAFFRETTGRLCWSTKRFQRKSSWGPAGGHRAGYALAGPCSLSSFRARVFEGERGRGERGDFLQKVPPFPAIQQIEPLAFETDETRGSSVLPGPNQAE